MGIDTTIEELVKTINTTGKMNIIYKSNLNRMRFNLEAELNIYRVIKETINNILKHSHTKELHIEIKNACDIIKITFNYIGLGLNNAQVEHLLRSEKGSGLKSIQSRINNLRATINYEVDKKGTAEIRIKIPADEIRN
jgi:signal transduction histidine kinase